MGTKGPSEVQSTSIFCWFRMFLEACYLFFRQMSTTSYVPGSAVNAEKTAVNKTDKNPCPHRVDIRIAEDNNKVNV